MSAGWSVVVPLKPPAVGKSRLRLPGVDHVALARAIALDTVAAAHATPSVVELLVVSADPTWSLPDGVRLVPEDAPTSIADAVALGVAAARPDTHRAVLLGDLPGLDPADLDSALRAAEAFDRSGVPDHEGTGTTLVACRAGVAVESHFGPGSWAAHERAGYRRLDVARSSTLRRDVDEGAHLAGRLGPRTTAVARLAPTDLRLLG